MWAKYEIASGFLTEPLAMTENLGFPSGNLAMTKEEQGVAGDSLTGCCNNYPASLRSAPLQGRGIVF
ncbi:MAG: hypothetical protein ACPLSK_04295, partial [bacterium]